MIEAYLIIGFLVAFVSTYLVTPQVIKKAKKYGFIGKDVHKQDKPEVAEMGGLAIILGFCLGVFFFIGLTVFEQDLQLELTPLLATVSSVLLVCIIGIMDDLFKIRWRTKIFLPVIAAIPLMALRIGNTVMTIPFIGQVELGLLYILLLVPLAVTGAANAVNMVAGYNGLETSLSSIILASLLVVSLSNNSIHTSILLISMLGALLAFLRYNWYPAKVFPGDTGTLQIGAVIAASVIIGNMEKIGLLLFTIYFINFALLLTRVVKKTPRAKFAKVNEEGIIESPYPYTIYFLIPKLMKVTETKLVTILILLQVLVSAATLGLHFYGVI